MKTIMSILFGLFLLNSVDALARGGHRGSHGGHSSYYGGHGSYGGGETSTEGTATGQTATETEAAPNAVDDMVPIKSSKYHRGPRRGCYTLSASGKKRYVDHSFCS